MVLGNMGKTQESSRIFTLRWSLENNMYEWQEANWQHIFWDLFKMLQV